MRVILAFLTFAVLAGCAAPGWHTAARQETLPTADPTPSDSPSQSPSPQPRTSVAAPPYRSPAPPRDGKGTFNSTASGQSAVFGTAGALKRYCVQVEDGIVGISADEFAQGVDRVLSDEHSWIAGKKWMFQRVPDCAGANVRVRLTTPFSVSRFCQPTQTPARYSCYMAGSLFINLDRWRYGVAHYPSLAEYRHMVINHEMGHFLGFQHAYCPGTGKLAPVMQQQSISLKGCVANPYPYPDGVKYLG